MSQNTSGQPSMKKQRRAAFERLTREDLHDAAVRVITREGLEGLTMERVAQEAGLAKGTLYLHFKNKQDLIDSVVRGSLDPLADELGAFLRGPLSAKDKLRNLPALHLGYFERNWFFFRILLYERDGAQRGHRRRKATRYLEFLDALAAVIAEGIRKRQFRPLDASKVAGMYAEAAIAMIHRRLLADAPGPLEADADLLAEVFLSGIAVR